MYQALVADSSKLFSRNKDRYLDITAERATYIPVDRLIDEMLKSVIAVLTGKEDNHASTKERRSGDEGGAAAADTAGRDERTG